MTPHHSIRLSLEELDRLHGMLVYMASHVEAMIGNGVKALQDGDVFLANRTIDDDDLVNELEIDIDDRCTAMLESGLHSARELRFAMSVCKIVDDLERISRLTVKICESVPTLATSPSLQCDELVRVGELVQALVHDAVQAFACSQELGGRDVIGRVSSVRESLAEVLSGILRRVVHDPRALENAVHLQPAADALESMADHAMHIAMQVIGSPAATSVELDREGGLAGSPVEQRRSASRPKHAARP